MFIILTILLLFTSCDSPFDKGTVSLNISKGAKKPLPIINSIKLENDLLKISGVNFSKLNSVKLNAQPLQVVSNDGSQLILSAASSVLLSLNTALSLVIETAYGASAVAVTFNLEDNSVTASKIADGQIGRAHLSQMGASSGQFLKWDGSEWTPSDLSSLVFLGSWDPTSASPLAIEASGSYFIASTSGTTNPNTGALDNSWNPGDWLISNGTSWEKIASSQGVKSFNSRTGNVLPAYGDYTWSDIDLSASTLSDIADIDLSTPANIGEVLKWDGTHWVAAPDEAVASNSVSSGAIINDSIVDADISSAAAISQSKIAGLSTSLSTLNSSITTNVSDIATLASNKVDKTTTVNGQALTGNISLTTTNVTEGVNLYYTDARSQTASVVNSTAGAQTNQAASVAAMKTYVTASTASFGNGDITAVVAGTGLTGGATSGSATLNVNVGTGANQIVQLNASSRLPAVDGSLLTNLPNPTTATVITGFVTGANSTVTNSDTVETAVEKIQGQINATNTTVTTKVGNTTTVNGKALSANVTLTTSDIAEGTNLYYTDVRAQTASVLNTTVGAQTTQAPSVSAMKSYVAAQTSTFGTGDFKSDGSVVMSADLDLGNNNLKLKSDNTNYVSLRAPNSLAANYSLILPVNDGSGGEYLMTNGSGVLSWGTPTGTGDITDVVAGAGLTGGASSGSATLNVNVGTGANQIVQLDASGRLPNVNGSLLTNLPNPTTSTVLTGFVTGASTTVTNTDTVEVAFEKLQGQVNTVSSSLGQNNTVSNIGSSGVGVYKQKTGVNFEMKKLATIATSAIAITDDTSNNRITFSVLPDNSTIEVAANALQVKNGGIDLTSKVSGILPVANGGTGASTDVLARANLGLGTSATYDYVSCLAGEVSKFVLPGGWSCVVDSGGAGSGDFLADGTVAMTADLDFGNNNAKFKSDNTNYVQIKAPDALAATYSLIFPATDGASGEVLTTDGSGVLSWSTPAGAGDITEVIAGSGLTGGATTGSATLNVNVGTSANQIVQLDGAARLPAVNGSLLTNLPNYTTSTILTGFVTGANSTVTNTDSVEVAFEKLQGQIDSISSGGEVNTGLSVGVSGVAVYKQKVGSQLQFRSIAQATSGAITVADDSANNEIDLSINVDNTSLEVSSNALQIKDGGVNLTTKVAGVLPIANGGTGASTDVLARASLGLGSSATYDYASCLAGEVSKFVLPGGWSCVTDAGGSGSGDFLADGTVSMTGDLDFGNNNAKFKSNNTNYVQLKAPDALAATYSLILPATDGASGEVLTTDGSGVLSWTSSSSPTAAILSGFVVGANTPVTNTDSVEVAFEKIQGQINTLSSGGEVNTASSVGISGVEIFKQKTASDLEFKNIASATSGAITVSDDTTNNEVDLAVNVDNTSIEISSNALQIKDAGVDLTTKVTGALPIANGGTGAITDADARVNLGLGTSATYDYASCLAGEVSKFVLPGGWSCVTDTGGSGSGDFLADGTVAMTGDLDFGNNNAKFKSDNANYVQIKAPDSLAATYSLILPATDGASGEVLTTDGSGVLSWTTPASSGDITDVVAGSGLTGGATSGSATLNVDVGTGAGQIVQLDVAAKLPAVDGSQLINLPNDTLTTVLTSFVTGADSSVLNTDTLEVALEKLQGQIDAMTTGSSPWTVTGSDINYATVGNVGIGVATPTEKLDVAGNINATQLCIAGDCKAAWPTAGAGSGDFLADGSVPMSGEFLAADGSGSTPSISFNSESTLGFYYAGVESIGLSSNGSVNFLMGAEIISATPGGGGISSIESSETEPAFRFQGDLNTGIFTPGVGSKTIAFTTDGVEKLRLDSVGNLGLNTASPEEMLHVNDGNILLSNDYFLTGKDTLDNITALIGRSANDDLIVGDDSYDDGATKIVAGDNSVIIQTNALDRVSVTSEGLVGIGVTEPAEQLHLHRESLASAILLESDDSSAIIFGNETAGGNDYILNSDASGNFEIYDLTTDEPRIFIENGGAVGIGTQTPGEALDVVGKIQGDEFCIAGDCLAAWPVGTVTQITGGAGLSDGPITGTGTLDINVDDSTIKIVADELVVNTGTGADQIVQLDGSAKLPAIDGSQLTNLPNPTNSTVLSGFVTGADTAVTNTDSVEVAIEKLQGQVSGNNTDIAAKENSITAGTTAQYFRGDKTFQTLDAAAVGLSNVTNVAQMPLSYLDTDTSLSADSDVKVASQKAVKAYVDAQVSGASSQWTTTGSDIYYNTGKVGVGTVSPIAKLHVEGTAFIGSGNTTFSSGSNYLFGSSNTITNSGGGNASGVTIIGSSNSLSTTNINFGYNTSIVGNSNVLNNAGSSNVFGWNNNLSGAVSLVYGNTNTSSAVQANIFGAGITNNISNSLMIGQNNTSKITILGSNGNVGIGTTSPDSILHLASTAPYITYEETDTTQKFFSGVDGSGWWIRQGTTANADLITLKAGGNFGIGTTNPAQKLDVNGNIAVSGSTVHTSDERFKDQIHPIESALSKIRKLNGVEFVWKIEEFRERQFQEGNDIGVIAQNVLEVFPEAVVQADDGYYSVAYSKLVAPLIEAVKELDDNLEMYKIMSEGTLKKVDENTRRIASLEKENKELKDRLEKLEKLIEEKLK